MTKTNKAGMNAKTGAAVVIEVVSETAFVPSNVTALVRVFSDMKKHVSKELKNEQSDVKALTIQAVIVVADMKAAGKIISDELVKAAIYEACGHDPDANANIEGRIKMRVLRAIRAAILASEKPEFVVAGDGQLQAQALKLKPTFIDKDQDGHVLDAKALSTDTTMKDVPQASIGSQFGREFPGTVKARPGAVRAGGKSSDATDQQNASLQMTLDTLVGKTTGKKATTINMDKQSLRVYLDIVASAKALHAIALANGCDGATQYIMQCMDNAPDLTAVA